MASGEKASVKALGLTMRSSDVLRQLGVKTIADLIQHTAEDLFAVHTRRGFGRKSLKEIREALVERGFDLRPSGPPPHAMPEVPPPPLLPHCSACGYDCQYCKLRLKKYVTALHAK